MSSCVHTLCISLSVFNFFSLYEEKKISVAQKLSRWKDVSVLHKFKLLFSLLTDRDICFHVSSICCWWRCISDDYESKFLGNFPFHLQSDSPNGVLLRIQMNHLLSYAFRSPKKFDWNSFEWQFKIPNSERRRYHPWQTIVLNELRNLLRTAKWKRKCRKTWLKWISRRR